MKQYKSVELVLNFNVNPPCINVKPPRTHVKPPIDDFLVTVLRGSQPSFQKQIEPRKWLIGLALRAR